jgi:hypothetical protein
MIVLDVLISMIKNLSTHVPLWLTITSPHLEKGSCVEPDIKATFIKLDRTKSLREVKEALGLSLTLK